MWFGGTEDEAVFEICCAQKWKKKVATMEEKGNKEARIMMCVENHTRVLIILARR